ncbi:MAG TPA: DUF3368 domain-containing protein [Thermoanaerobaculia bacterium]
MRVVIVDSSTLIHLFAIGRLPLLTEIFGRWTVPPAVWREVVEQGKDRARIAALEALRDEDRLELREPTNLPLVRALQADLDEGEAEVIALATETSGSLAVLDEAEARRIATTFGIEKTGAIGILLRAKLEGRIEALRPDLDRLRTEAGFWIADPLYRTILAAAGE